MRKTFLQCVNSVLVRLRSSTVNASTERAYSRLIAEMVNQSIREVEDRHYWTDLYTVNTVTTSSGTNTYSLTGWFDRGRVDAVYCTTTNRTKLRPVSNADWQGLDTTVDNARPDRYRLYLFDSEGDPQIQFYRTPDTAYSIEVSGWVGQGEIEVDTTIILVPSLPVVLRAYALALKERGEDGGGTYAESMDEYESALYQAIELDDESQSGGRAPAWTVG